MSSENRVFAGLLAERDDRFDALVVVHEEEGSTDGGAAAFSTLARCPTVGIDTGWRPSKWSHRGDPARVNVALRFWRRLDRTIDAAVRFQPSVVYSSQQHYDLRAATRVARSLTVPQIVHLHYTVGPWLRQVVLRQLRTTDQVVTVSDFIREQAIRHGVPEERATTIRNTVAPYQRPDREATARLRRDLGLHDDQYVFGLVGRLDPGKGHLDAIAAFEDIARRRDDVVLVLVGTGRLENRVRHRARRSAAAERIVFTGQRADVPALLATFDTQIHPASQDPCPLAVLEAMAAGLPVIGYRDGGVPELVDSGTTGLLVEVGDVPALAEAMLHLHDDPATGRAFGEAGARRAATEFAPASAGQHFADLLPTIVPV